ncbi:MAG: hypothetical protein PF501_10960 [Salinisphaera sp.]|nr:hypothetical protein [Salinisphaera sp.]
MAGLDERQSFHASIRGPTLSWQYSIESTTGRPQNRQILNLATQPSVDRSARSGAVIDRLEAPISVAAKDQRVTSSRVFGWLREPTRRSARFLY